MHVVDIKKIDHEKQICFAEVYAPDITDSHGDFMNAEEIEKMAYGFMKNMRLDQVDVGHDNVLHGSHVVESFIAREDDSIFIAGAWVVGIHVADSEVWSRIKSGELNGFSMEALALKKESSIMMKCPVSLTGETDVEGDDGHTHHYTVFVDEDGKFAGGSTSIVNGHKHDIMTGTITEDTNDHVHKYSFVETILELGNDGDEEDTSE